jgi:hypothetical protein
LQKWKPDKLARFLRYLLENGDSPQVPWNELEVELHDRS